LIKALKTDRLAGVWLNVYEGEEGIFFEDLSGGLLHDHELAQLLTFPNVLIPSHEAFLTAQALTEIAGATVANIGSLAEQEPLVEGSLVA
jgi:D-lactate dehydrogenase